MKRALAVEFLKLRRSSVVLSATALIVLLIPAMCVGLVAVAAQDVGVGAAALKARAMVVGEGWDAYLGLVAQMGAVSMFIGPGVVVAWSFGREYADRTFPALFALPVSRCSIVVAKFFTLWCWCLLLTIALLMAVVIAGLVTPVGPPDGIELSRVGRLFVSVFLTATMALTMGPVASVGRGYLPAIAALILITMAAQLAVVFGVGAWFPYAAPGLYALAGIGVPTVNTMQLLLVPLTTLAAAGFTARWWARAEVL